jgi:hypothetical protein
VSEARLLVGVEISAEENEVVGKVYDAKSQLKYAAEPRDAHLDGSVRAALDAHPLVGVLNRPSTKKTLANYR